MTQDEVKEAIALYASVSNALGHIRDLQGYRGKTRRVRILFEGEQRSYGDRDLVFHIVASDAEAARMAEAEIATRIAGWRAAIAKDCRRLAQLGCAPPKGV